MWLTVLFLCAIGFNNGLSKSFELGAVTSGNRMAAVPLGRSFGEGEVDVEGICQGPGVACQDCKTAITCVSLPVGFLKMPLERCGEGLTCNAYGGGCSKNPVPECRAETKTYKHTCEQVGIFPDAFDCRKFHLCSPPEAAPEGRPAEHRSALCPRHYAYNPRNAQCSIPLPKSQCVNPPVPDCTTVGHIEVLPSSPHHYYVCLMKNGVLTPQIFICPHGWYFADGFCRSEEVKAYDDAFKDESKEATKVVAEVATTTSTTAEPRRSIFDSYPTEAPVTYAPDNFLADKFDLANYEGMEESNGAYGNDNNFSFENNFY